MKKAVLEISKKKKTFLKSRQPERTFHMGSGAQRNFLLYIIKSTKILNHFVFKITFSIQHRKPKMWFNVRLNQCSLKARGFSLPLTTYIFAGICVSTSKIVLLF